MMKRENFTRAIPVVIIALVILAEVWEKAVMIIGATPAMQ
jgi:hypothetical protein